MNSTKGLSTFFGQCRCCLAKGYHKDLMKEYYFNGIREVYFDIFMESLNLFPAPCTLASSLVHMLDATHIFEDPEFQAMKILSIKELITWTGIIRLQQILNIDLDLDHGNLDDKLGILSEMQPHLIEENTLSTNALLPTLICSTCVQRLRDATSFRMMVVSTERQLLQAIAGDDKDTVFVNVHVEENTLENRVDVKTEEQTEVKQELDDTDIDVVDNESDYIVSDYVSDSAADNYVDQESALLSRFAHDKLPPLPTRRDLPGICPEYCRHLDQMQNITVQPNRIMKLLDDDPDRRRFISGHRRLFMSEKLAHIINAGTILEHSNATPFKSKGRTGFPCFYCRNVFENLEKLREHTNNHKKSEIKSILKTYGAECLVVYVDITDLKCTICDKKIKNISELKSHLTNVHKKYMHLEYTDRVIPFKLTPTGAYECQICGFNFETFGSVERHMNVHFRNYVCKECGSGFVTKYRLKVHTKSMHVGGNFPCELCGKIFTTLQKHKNHVNTVHKLLKRFKCTKCPERFSEYFKRQKHLVQVHGVAPLQYKCNVCEKSFDRRYTLSRHMKRDHLEERDYQCEMCSYNCFTRNELRVHMVKHNGERIFECSVCKKSYARKKTLKEHMRIHNNDRRFACAVCGQAFVQKCSLKGHLKTHHLEFSLQ